MSDTLRAGLWMIGAIISFTSMAVAGRAVSLDLDTFEIMMYRSMIGLVLVLVIASMARTLRQITTRSLGWHLIRNISHFTGQNLWFYAIASIPLAQVFALEFTSPLWVIVLSPLVLGERLTRTRAIAALFGFIGILIVTRPSPETMNFGLLTAALAAIGFAGSAVFTRRLTRTETITCILFYLTVMQAVFGLICAGFDGDIAWPSAASWPWILVIGCAGLMAHFCLTTALSIAPATVVMPIDFARLPVIAVLGMLVYSEPLDPFVILGAAIIFVANYYNIWHETRPHPRNVT
ncbi:DMT transporter permease [Puniceibacterium antarcticum]|uniref:DMT transporter permease n=1 Tax=Puniceibacterium antarcticum TaxID=1206336 RepID=A0A2G8RB33_9RHOB|nr:DMT family transporter [Puniceibacterium antarcticum]PIL18760.1 DMT transporter permease [Puniceibacterium antarcticum]